MPEPDPLTTIAQRHRIDSPWACAALKDVLSWDAPPVRAFKPPSKSTALEYKRLHDALRVIDTCRRELKRRDAEARSGVTGDSQQLRASGASLRLVMAAESCGLILKPEPRQWLIERLPAIDPNLLKLLDAFTRLPKVDARTLPKRNLQEVILVQVLAVIIKAGSGNASAMSGTARGPTRFQDSAFMVWRHLQDRWHAIHPKFGVPAAEALQLEGKNAFRERVANAH